MSRGAVVVMLAVVAAHCGGQSNPTAPTAPAPGGGISVVRAVTVDRTNVEAGDEVNLQVTLEGTTPASQLRFTWSVNPPAGALTSDGPSARWRAPLNDPVPATYTFFVSVVQPDGTAAAHLAASSATNGATSPQVTVNDARREMEAHGQAFLADSVNAAVSPEMCVRNFADSCEGKGAAFEEIVANRGKYSTGTIAYELQLFVRSIEWPNCTAPDRSARCAVLIYSVNLLWTHRADGALERVSGDQYLWGVYEQNRWWLCSSQLTTDTGAVR